MINHRGPTVNLRIFTKQKIFANKSGMVSGPHPSLANQQTAVPTSNGDWIYRHINTFKFKKKIQRGDHIPLAAMEKQKHVLW